MAGESTAANTLRSTACAWVAAIVAMGLAALLAGCSSPADAPPPADSVNTSIETTYETVRRATEAMYPGFVVDNVEPVTDQTYMNRPSYTVMTHHGSFPAFVMRMYVSRLGDGEQPDRWLNVQLGDEVWQSGDGVSAFMKLDANQQQALMVAAAKDAPTADGAFVVELMGTPPEASYVVWWAYRDGLDETWEQLYMWDGTTGEYVRYDP